MEDKNEKRICQNCKQDFTIEPDDFSFYEKMKVPAPTFCPECRFVRRLNSRNERSLFKTICGLCNKSTITMYNPVAGYIVYCSSCYQSDAWDPLSYGKEYDFSRPFFEQYRDLLQIVPKRAVHGINPGRNTEYSNYIFNSTDVFLAYSVVRSEGIYHSRGVDISKQCIDCTNIKECESCYQIVQGTRNYGSKFLVDSRDCIDSQYLYDCANCSSCFMSSNLRNKQYVYKGEQLTKEVYQEAIKKYNIGSFKVKTQLMAEFKELIENKTIHRFARIFKSVDSTGDYIENSKSVKKSFEVFEAENAKYGWRLTDGPTDMYDVAGSGKSELLYEAVGAAWGSRNSSFFIVGNATIDSSYCDYCLNVSNIFGSVSLRNVQYVILNKQYTKEEYEILIPKIIEHMKTMPYIDQKERIYSYGEFFPQICVAHAYNESLAQEYFPLSKEEVISRGYLWRDPEIKNNQSTIAVQGIPDSIEDIPDDFIKEAIECMHNSVACDHQCTKAFRLNSDELVYLKKWNLPIPRLCPNCRHCERLDFRTPAKLWHRSCMCDLKGHFHGDGHCEVEFETSYAPERPEKVYCERCYQAEVL
ncbi:MAG: hypothetical protein AAB477_00660 [Patescibacteria group bacterium]